MPAYSSQGWQGCDARLKKKKNQTVASSLFSHSSEDSNLWQFTMQQKQIGMENRLGVCKAEELGSSPCGLQLYNPIQHS